MVLPQSKGPNGGPRKHEFKVGTHDENQHEHGQVWRRSGAPSTSVVSEEIRFKVEVKWPFLDKIGPGEG